MNRSLKSSVKRLGAIAAVFVAAGLVSATPASADSPEPTSSSVLSDRQIAHARGSMRFIDSGDVFEICDWQADGAGVVGQLWYKPALGGDWHVADSKQDPEGGGCTKMPSEVEIVGNYQMRLFWNGYELARSEVFRE